MQYGPMEHLQLWKLRAAPTITRMLARRKPVNYERMTETMRLVMLVERGLPEVFAPDKMSYSHHLSKCPFKTKRGTQQIVASAHA
jgi:hypothetical protein